MSNVPFDHTHPYLDFSPPETVCKDYKALNPNDLDPKFHAYPLYNERNNNTDTQPLTPEYFKQLVDSFKKDYSQEDSTKLIFFIRHGEGYHNVACRELGNKKWYEEGYHQSNKYFDPLLTSIGIEQSQQVKPYFINILNEIELIVMSSLRRTMDTANNSILPMLKLNKDKIESVTVNDTNGTNSTNSTNSNGIDETKTTEDTENTVDTEEEKNNDETKENLIYYKCNVVIHELARERMFFNTCDNRRDLNEIKKDWINHNIEYIGFTSNIDNLWKKERCETMQELHDRSVKLLNFFMKEKNEKIIVYFGHGAIIRMLTFIINNNPIEPSWGPRNCACIPVILSNQINKNTDGSKED